MSNTSMCLTWVCPFVSMFSQVFGECLEGHIPPYSYPDMHKKRVQDMDILREMKSNVCSFDLVSLQATVGFKLMGWLQTSHLIL